jgi:1,2-diacylglycerol 3-alpha-glucosyltransferase
MKKIAIQFARFGPYHLARIAAAVKVLANKGWEVVGLETAGTDSTYAWKEETEVQPWKRHTVFPGEEWETLAPARARQGMIGALDELNPDAVLISGWGSPDARACLDWCRKNKARSIVVSETREADGQRVWWKEWLKGKLVQRFDAALVGGNSHRDYLVKLGIPRDRIETGYNVVNNAFFAINNQRFKDQDSQLNLRRYFLASNRFIGRKNLRQLIEAFAKQRNEGVEKHPAWDLCLLGDGPLKEELMALCGQLNLAVHEGAPWEPVFSFKEFSSSVYFPGFRQIDELSRFYAHAGCFVHPAEGEPWGLVINEAMACGLPILSGDNVGAAEELVENGVNGWKFSAESVDEIAVCLQRFVGMGEEELRSMGEASVKLLEMRCPTLAFGKGLAKLLVSER